jgi:hypothetical protein
MSDYDENSNIFNKISNTETKSVEIVQKKEVHDIDVDERSYGVNKPYRIIIKAKVSHDKD